MPKQRPYFDLVIPKEYATAIGEAIAQWAFFEVDLDGSIHVMRLHPKAKALATVLPTNHKKRLRLFKDSVEAAFENYPALLPRFRSIGDRASTLLADRNDLAHGRWYQGPNQTYGAYTVRLGDWGNVTDRLWPLDRIQKVTRRIGKLHAELDITVNYGPRGHWLLTSEEIAALRRFQSDNYPPLPTP